MIGDTEMAHAASLFQPGTDLFDGKGRCVGRHRGEAVEQGQSLKIAAGRENDAPAARVA